MLQIEVIGNIGNDAEIKDFSGKKYVAFNVAHLDKTLLKFKFFGETWNYFEKVDF